MRKIKLLIIYIIILARKKLKIIILTLVPLIILIALYLNFSNVLVKKTLSEGVIGTYREQDLPEVVTRLLSKPLIEVDRSGLPNPNLVSGWEVSEDGKVYKLKLKNNIYWGNGEKIKASDIEIVLPDVEQSIPDEATIQLKIVDSFSPFLTLLNKPIFKKNTKIGLGPYSISSIQKDQIFVKKIILKTDDKNLPNLTVKFYPNEKIAKNALSLGEISILLGVSELEDLKTQKTLKISSKTNYQQLVTIFYNTKDPALSDENLRLALSFAAPSISKEEEAKTSIPKTSWAFNSEVKDYLENPAQAKDYFSKVEKKDSVITLTATSFLKNIGEKVVEAWGKAGIKAVLRVESGIPQNFQALLIAQNIPPDPDQYSLWHSTQVTNISKYSSPRIDRDLEDGRKSLDQEVRKARYQDFQKVLLDHAPATFLYFPKYNVVYREKVEKDFQKILPYIFPQFSN